LAEPTAEPVEQGIEGIHCVTIACRATRAYATRRPGPAHTRSRLREPAPAQWRGFASGAHWVSRRGFGNAYREQVPA
jgi:hypothetical protein